MVRVATRFALSTVAWAVALGWLVWGSAPGEPRIQLLSAAEMRGAARGANPGVPDCTHNLYTAPCKDKQ